MWVKHQNDLTLGRYTTFTITSNGGIIGYDGPEDCEGATIAVYKSKKRADIVMNSLINFMEKGAITKRLVNGIEFEGVRVFNMPKV